MDLLHTVGDQGNIQIRDVLRGQCLGEIERAIKAATQCFFE